MTPPVRSLVSLTVVAALLCIVTASVYHPPSFSQDWLLTFGILLLLALIGAALSVRVTSAGSTTSINFLLHLGAIPLLGPLGAVLLAGVSMLIADVFIRHRPKIKILFNSSQAIFAAGIASFFYVSISPAPSLSTIDITASLLPFLGAGLLYFAANSVLVTYVIAADSNRSFVEVWNNIAGKILFIDIALTPIALSVPLLHINWGTIGLLLIIVPIIGLRYSLGLNLELRNLNRDLLRVLVRTLEAQDPYTSGHSVRVSENARRIAEELGLRRGTTHQIETAALLHDIGKIGQDYSTILRQEGTLSEEQRQLIEDHPDRGAEIVEPVRSLDPAVIEAIRHHHERYDGTGYPERLEGDDIPIGARIIMVADTIDAMATDRPYRASLSTQEIRQELIRFAGKQFDPEIVQAALDAGILEQEPYATEGPAA